MGSTQHEHPGGAGGVPGGDREEAELRASDADRQRVADILGQHCSAGRLDVEEYVERVSRAYAARSLPELLALTADLPYPDAVVPVTRRGVAERPIPRARPVANRVRPSSPGPSPSGSGGPKRLGWLAPWRWIGPRNK